MKLFIAFLVVGSILFIIANPTPIVWRRIEQTHVCAQSELFYNPTSPTFLQGGASLFAVGKYVCQN